MQHMKLKHPEYSLQELKMANVTFKWHKSKSLNYFKIPQSIFKIGLNILNYILNPESNKYFFTCEETIFSLCRLTCNLRKVLWKKRSIS